VRTWNGLQFKSNYRKPTSPKANSDEVLVEVHAAAINPVDYKAPRLILGPVAGLDVAGVVAAVGDNSLSGLSVGDRVYGTAKGSLADFVLAQGNSLAKIPENISFEQAAALPTTYITGLQGLRDTDKGNFKAGARVLIIGASGGCGIAAVQIAKAMSAGEIVGVCSSKNAETVKQEGVDKVLDYNIDGFGEEYVNAAEKDKFDLIYDTATNSGGGEDYKAWSMKRLKKDGQYVAINGNVAMWLRMFTKTQLKNQHLFITDMNTKDLDHLSNLMTAEGSTLRPKILKSFSFTAATVEEGFKLLKSRRTVGKIVFFMK